MTPRAFTYADPRAPRSLLPVYDNQRSRSVEDQFISILPGVAHLSNTPFSSNAYGWGAWRDRRQFVGRCSYSIRWLLWNPTREAHLNFKPHFRASVRTLLLCQRRRESPVSMLGDDCLFYIANFLPHDWFPEPPRTGARAIADELGSSILSHLPAGLSVDRLPIWGDRLLFVGVLAVLWAYATGETRQR